MAAFEKVAQAAQTQHAENQQNFHDNYLKSAAAASGGAAAGATVASPAAGAATVATTNDDGTITPAAGGANFKATGGTAASSL